MKMVIPNVMLKGKFKQCLVRVFTPEVSLKTSSNNQSKKLSKETDLRNDQVVKNVPNCIFVILDANAKS